MLILKNKIIIVNVVINGIKKKKNVCKDCELKFLIFVIVKICCDGICYCRIMWIIIMIDRVWNKFG